MTDEIIYHITHRDEWAEAQEAASYRAPSLETQGYIHFSTLSQVVQTANRFYRGQDGLVLLCVDVSRLRAPLRYEPPDIPGENERTTTLFPHLYGPLELDAVVNVVPFPDRADGSFALPAELQASHAGPVAQATQVTEETAQRLLRLFEDADPVRRLRASQLASGLLGAVGFALFVVGVERAAEDIPVISNAYGSIAVGLILLLATGLLLRKLAGGE